MNPRSPDNLEIVLREDLSNRQKIEALLPEAPKQDEEYLKSRFNWLVENAKRFAVEVDDGTNRSAHSAVNYQAEPLKIADLPSGELMLDYFIYAPGNLSHGRSLYATWRLNEFDSGQSRLVLEEYLSNRSFNPNIAAYNSNAPRILELMEDSLAAYKRAASPNSSRISDFAYKFLNFVFKHSS